MTAKQPVTNKETTPLENSDEPLSRTRQKIQMLELQKLGEELVKLTAKQLEKIPLPENLASAVKEAQKMTKRRALYRQRQFIGKVMRHVDAEPIIEALEAIRHPDRLANERFHRVESWRNKMIEAADKTTTEFIEQFPSVDIQQLTQKVRAACKEKQSGKPAGAGRALFRFIDQLVAQSLQTGDADTNE